MPQKVVLRADLFPDESFDDTWHLHTEHWGKHLGSLSTVVEGAKYLKGNVIFPIVQPFPNGFILSSIRACCRFLFISREMCIVLMHSEVLCGPALWSWLGFQLNIEISIKAVLLHTINCSQMDNTAGHVIARGQFHFQKC